MSEKKKKNGAFVYEGKEAEDYKRMRNKWIKLRKNEWVIRCVKKVANQLCNVLERENAV